MQTVISIAAVIILLLVGAVGYFIRKSIIEKLDKIDDKLSAFMIEILKDYVRKEDFKSNENSHKEMWKELAKIKERVVKVEK